MLLLDTGLSPQIYTQLKAAFIDHPIQNYYNYENNPTEFTLLFDMPPWFWFIKQQQEHMCSWQQLIPLKISLIKKHTAIDYTPQD